jgi:hypothetical protein
MTLPPILRGLLAAAGLLLICQPAFAGKRHRLRDAQAASSSKIESWWITPDRVR